jgi:PAS domain S-box-containing protein
MLSLSSAGLGGAGIAEAADTVGTWRTRLQYAYAMAALLNVVLVVVAAAALYQQRAQAEALAAATTQNLGLALGSSVSQLIARADQALLTVKEGYEAGLASGAVDEPWLERLIQQQHAHLTNVDSLRIALASGDIRYGIGVAARPGQTIGDREYYRIHRDALRQGLVLAEPVIGKISRKWVMILSRRLDGPGGQFAGVVYAGVLVDALTGLFASLDLGPDGVVALRDGQLRLVARYPPDPSIQGRPVSQTLEQLLASGVTSGSYVTAGSPDGIARRFAFRRLGEAPLFLIVGISRDTYLAPWRRSVALQSLLVTVSLLGTALALRALRRATAREELAMRRVEEQEERYRIVAEYTSDWEYWISPEGKLIYCSPSCAAVTGHAAEEFYADAGTLRRLLHPDDLQAFVDHERDVTAHHAPGSLVVRVQHTDGKYRWIHHVCAPIVDAAGRYLGARGSNRDVTETKEQQDLVLAQKRALEATLARTRRLEGIIEICMYCKRINNANRSWEQMEKYISDNSDAEFSHGICPECWETHGDD